MISKNYVDPANSNSNWVSLLNYKNSSNHDFFPLQDSKRLLLKRKRHLTYLTIPMLVGNFLVEEQSAFNCSSKDPSTYSLLNFLITKEGK